MWRSRCWHRERRRWRGRRRTRSSGQTSKSYSRQNGQSKSKHDLDSDRVIENYAVSRKWALNTLSLDTKYDRHIHFAFSKKQYCHLLVFWQVLLQEKSFLICVAKACNANDHLEHHLWINNPAANWPMIRVFITTLVLSVCLQGNFLKPLCIGFANARGQSTKMQTVKKRFRFFDLSICAHPSECL